MMGRMAESIYQRIRAQEHGKIAIPCRDGIRVVEWITADYDEFSEDVITMYVEEPELELEPVMDMIMGVVNG